MVAGLAIGALCLLGLGLLVARQTGPDRSGGGRPGAAEPSSTPAAVGSNVFTIWADDAHAEPIKQSCDLFAEANGITCEVVPTEIADIRDRLVEGGRTGDVPDLALGEHQWIGALAEADLIAPVDLGADAAGLSPGAVRAVTHEGLAYGVPYAVQGTAMLANPKLWPSCPRSQDLLQAAAQELKDSGAASLPLALPIGEQGDPYHWYPLYSADGGYIFGAAETDVNDLGVGRAGSVRAAQRLGTMAAAGLLDPATTAEGALRSYTAGRSAWLVTGPWSIDAAVAGVPGTRVCPVPDGDQPARPFISAQAFLLPRAARNPVVGQAFLQDYVMTTPFMDAMYEADPAPPAWTASAEKVTDPLVRRFMQIGRTGIPVPAQPEMAAVWGPLGLAQFQVASGADPASTMAAAGQEIEESVTSR